jgi:peptidoglycan hydrolase CwlO-like protein
VSATHKAIALITQLVGGLLILYSIDSNIGIIKDRNLTALLTAYLREFPLVKRHFVIEAESGAMGISSFDAKITVTRSPKTLEEKLEYLQEQITNVKTDIERNTKKINDKIDQNSKKVEAKISETKSDLRSLETKIEKVSIGGIKIQFLGVLLMGYGAITSYIA